ncbi:alpha/beta fold hydrolase [Albibacterium bauzanense]|uniref:Pimeloyl-ACP methyl ester carboxylesterase n=1 Tax=Albibacterium bauzanense TaxID=653929 RepID=A0A4R1M0K5_9SPHI|nr:alpha/beta hydrolase [Albibacterium bauzanense]TCK85145.1 pimeloyl-ACP methyl ester carboxylesterase [Albibacterium bauzanense]
MNISSYNFKHSQVLVNGISTHVVEAGDKSKQTILCLHGYPETWMEFEQLMRLLQDDYHIMAIDLPGIGQTESIASTTKLSIAKFIKNLLDVLGLKNIVLVGHDVGGMVCYAFIKHFFEYLSKAVIMCTAVPGVAPWEQVKRNPFIWHFAFFSVPELPEQLISGKLNLLFDYFYNSIAAKKDAIAPDRREKYVQAYNSKEALSTSLGWYRSFAEDEKERNLNIISDVPLLYLKGAEEQGNIEDYVQGFQLSGLTQVKAKKIVDSGHFAPEENSDAVASLIDDFVRNG